MNRLAGVVVGAVLIVACNSTSHAPAVAPARAEREILDKQIAIKAEIARLGPTHPWAGIYSATDGAVVRIELTLAPDGGCVATWRGFKGLEAVNFGRVTHDRDRLHIEFELPNTPGEFGNFETDFVIQGNGDDVRLVTVEPSVLLVVSPGGLLRD
jgi:hypothetical protein